MTEPAAVDIPFAVTAGPAVPTPVCIPYASAAVRAYHSPKVEARRLITVLWMGVVVELVMLWPTIGTVVAHLSATSDEGREFDPVLIGAAAWTQVALNIVWTLSLVFWLTWVHRTYSNLAPLGAEGLTYSPRWAVAYNLIPGLHLFRPFQVTHETWRASDPRHEGGTTWRRAPSSALVNWWWGTYLLAALASVASLLLDTEDNDRPRLIAAASAGAATALLVAAAFFMEIHVVRRITAMQDERAGRVGTMAPPKQDAPSPGA